ncbi:MAG TPA: YraN family protein [Bryobacteraceae bacterium]
MWGRPNRAVDAEKQNRVQRAARDYVRHSGANWEQTRFDIVSVLLVSPPRIEWIRDAFRR